MKKPIALSSLAILGLVGCQPQPKGPYDTGLTVTTEAEETRVTKTFLIREGDDEPSERKATLGYGDECSQAKASAGTTTLTEIGRSTVSWEVIGQTESSHPLVPGTESYGAVGVSVVEATESFEGDSELVETFRDPNAEVTSWEETNNSQVARTSAASYRGISADEYVVGLSSLGDLWSSLDDEESELGVELITRNSPQASDLWSSVDGSMLYMAEGPEEVSLAGDKANAMRVDVLTVADPDPSGGNLVDKCIAESVAEFVTNHPDFEDGTVTAAELDTGCDGAFVHQEIGTEWWYGNVLVQAQKEQYEVEILDYGYEWYESDGAGCQRFTSATQDDPDAELFIEYAVTTITTDLHTTQYEVVMKE